MINAAPIPCRTRKTMRDVIEPARPHRRELKVKRNKPVINAFLRPNWSARREAASRKTANDRL
ncbi:hypothetical protein YDYSY3_04170 [Paenibacillus chitinolyticus]|nr:hypothetical protein YDYSY3_04170 [Paenibacillus chitinolyticus]